jgi:hypothetical protein
MPRWKRRLLGLGIPCLLAFSFDVGMTFSGQPAEYWAGDYSQTNEASPVIRKLFQMHPAAAAAGEAVWAAIILIWVILLPETLATIAAIAIVFGHTAGGFTWLHILPDRRWFQPLNGLLVVAAAVVGSGLHWSLKNARLNNGSGHQTHFHPVLRWTVIAAACALACYLYLIPQ